MEINPAQIGPCGGDVGEGLMAAVGNKGALKQATAPDVGFSSSNPDVGDYLCSGGTEVKPLLLLTIYSVNTIIFLTDCL